MKGFVPHSAAPRAPGRRMVGSAFRLGGLALAVGADVRPAGTATIPRQRPGCPPDQGPSTDPG